MFSQKDVEMAREIIYYHNKADKELDSQKATHVNKDELHNKYNGLVWALFNKGRIFQVSFLSNLQILHMIKKASLLRQK